MTTTPNARQSAGNPTGSHHAKAKTSESDPLWIGEVSSGGGQGLIGITLCPGKTDRFALTGWWARHLDTDLEAIRVWGATAVVTLLEQSEMDDLGVADLGEAVRDRGMEWLHLPTRDGHAPSDEFERTWTVAGPTIRSRLRRGLNVLVHCKGGLGRAGTVAARLLVELGAPPDDAIRRVRAARGPGAIRDLGQEAYVRRCRPRGPARE